MKNPSIRQNHSKAEHTTNYPKSSHIDFCYRCFVYNRKCPNNGARLFSKVDRTCNL